MARIDLIQLRRGTAAAWTAANPILAAGEEGHETDTGKRKIGDGSTVWTGLEYFGTVPEGVYVKSAIAIETPAPTVVLDLSDDKSRRLVTIEENTVFSVINDDAQPVFLLIVGTGAGGFDYSFWAGIQWQTEGGVAPTPTAAAGAYDAFSFIKLGVGNYLGFVVPG